MLDVLLDKKWTKDYTCHEFSKDAWKLITGKKLVLGKRKEVNSPVSPCVVFLFNNERSDSHVGVFYEGKIIHLSMRGVQYIELDLLKLCFKNVRYYA